MKNIIGDLQEGSRKKDPMIPTTVRIAPDTEEDIRNFCAKHKIIFAVLLREIIDRGWESVREASTEREDPR